MNGFDTVKIAYSSKNLNLKILRHFQQFSFCFRHPR